MMDTHTFSVVQSMNGKLNKSFATDGTKTSNAHLAFGSYRVETVRSVRELFECFATLRDNEAIIPSVPKREKTEGMICSNGASMEGAIHRTKEDFAFNGNHILCFDYDPDLNGYEITSPQHYAEVLRIIDPDLNNCEIGVTFGSSYGVHNGDDCINNKLSLHAYALVRNATDERVQEYKESFRNAAWKLGFGHVKISKSGSLLQRQVFDDVVFSPERLLFEAKPTLAAGLTQIRPENYIVGEGARDLSSIEINDGQGKRLFEEAKERKAPEAKIIRDKYIDEKATELVKTQGYSYEIAKETVKKRVEEGVLTADDILYSKDKGIVKVSAILLNPEPYKNLNVLDPINPKQGEFVAMIFINESNIVVHSFKHGGVNYKLVANEAVIEELVSTADNRGDADNKKFVSNIITLCDGAGINESKRKELAVSLKLKKIVTSVTQLKTKARAINFPDFKYVDGEIRFLSTFDNLKVFLEHKGIVVKYDEILKEGMLNGGEAIKGFTKDTDDKINSQFAKIRSECIKVGLPERIVDSYLPSIIDSNSVNPLLDMVKSIPWDHVDRLSNVLTCLITKDEQFYVQEITTNWLVQCVAAWDYARSSPIPNALPRFENIFVAQGSQGLQKTKFFEHLVPRDLSQYVITGVSLDTRNKDIIKLAISAGIAELGELDSTFNREVAEIKAFLSKREDRMRLPYAHSEINYKRRTSFCASVNPEDFLVDPTGNRRFQPIALTSIDFDTYLKIDKQQLWAQVWSLYLDGRKWWIDPAIDVELYQMLNKKHSSHMMLTGEDDIIERVISDTLYPVNNSSYSDPLGIGVPKTPYAVDSDGYVWKCAADIGNHYKISPSKRGFHAKLKKALVDANIECKRNRFKVRLAS